MERQGHKKFAAFWELMTRFEGKTEKDLRRQVVQGARGKVLEVGVGVGTNWAYLPDGTEYTGIEPDPHMLRRARERAGRQARSLDLQPMSVEDMPFPDDSFDTVLATLIFCSVENPSVGLREIRRVLKPGGQFRFAEHVRAHKPLLAGVQSALKPLTRRFGGGCEWDRDTEAAIRAAGFEVETLRRARLAFMPIIVGSARKPSGDAQEA